MIIGVYWCERQKLWVRFSKEDGAVTAEVAEVSSDEPGFTTDWQAVNQGTWLVDYKLGCPDPINEVYSLKNGVFEQAASSIGQKEIKLRVYADLPLTPEMRGDEEKDEKAVIPFFNKPIWSFAGEVAAAEEQEQEEDYQLQRALEESCKDVKPRPNSKAEETAAQEEPEPEGIIKGFW